MKPTVVTHTGDRIVDTVQRNVQSQADVPPFVTGRMLTGVPDSKGRLSDGITCQTATRQVLAHGLGRVAQGFIPVMIANRFAASPLSLDASYDASDTDLSKQIAFTPTSDGVCWIWVF